MPEHKLTVEEAQQFVEWLTPHMREALHDQFQEIRDAVRTGHEDHETRIKKLETNQMRSFAIWGVIVAGITLAWGFVSDWIKGIFKQR
jgi:hypothetical protein